ncbi:unnamed protein product [Moneuplotes crassus]|uniref:Uncharacterized protein n=1 Tax=Euplotes crassus TaxID=5936 RepID=A0AAD1U995_EUPCR|nr:unnamed protein product [Moneuplotes crassus]
MCLDFTVKGMQFSRNTAKQSDLHSPKKNRKVDFIKFKNTQRGPIQSLKIQKSYMKEGRVQSLTERKPNYLKYNNHLKKSIKDLLHNPPLKFNIEEYKTINPDQKKQNKLNFYKSSPKSKNNLKNSKKKLSLSKNKIFQAHGPAGVIKGSLTARNNHNGKSLRDFEQSIKRHNTKRAKRIPNRVYEIIRLKVKSQRRRIDSKTAHFLKDHMMRYEQISSTIKNIKRG